MNLTDNKFLDLVKPSDFIITSKEKIINRWVERINYKLKNILIINKDEDDPENEIYPNSVLDIDLECDLERDKEEVKLTPDVYESIINIFISYAGWKNVGYSFFGSKEDYPFHRFSFYFGDGDHNKHEDSFKIT